MLRIAAAAAVAVPPVEQPSGPNCSWPPLWFEAKSLTNSSCFADDGIALVPFDRYWTTWVSPFLSV